MKDTYTKGICDMDHHFARAKFSDISIANQLFGKVTGLRALWLAFPITDMSV